MCQDRKHISGKRAGFLTFQKRQTNKIEPDLFFGKDRASSVSVSNGNGANSFNAFEGALKPLISLSSRLYVFENRKHIFGKRAGFLTLQKRQTNKIESDLFLERPGFRGW